MTLPERLAALGEPPASIEYLLAHAVLLDSVQKAVAELGAANER